MNEFFWLFLIFFSQRAQKYCCQGREASPHQFIFCQSSKEGQSAQNQITKNPPSNGRRRSIRSGTCSNFGRKFELLARTLTLSLECIGKKESGRMLVAFSIFRQARFSSFCGVALKAYRRMFYKKRPNLAVQYHFPHPRSCFHLRKHICKFSPISSPWLIIKSTCHSLTHSYT